MKHFISIISICILFFSSPSLSAQKSCKVLLPEIDSVYKGKCKKGLAHGKGIAYGIDTYKGHFSKGLPSGRGTYSWNNGDQYIGSWKNGMRNGEGKLSLKIADRDSIIDGLWENNKYLGPKPIAPKVLTKVSVDRYSFKKYDDHKDRVLINFLQNGSINRNIYHMTIISSTGVETTLGSLIGYDFIDFPVIIKVNYETLNKLKSVIYQVIFEFEITDPGDWRVEIHN